MMEKLLHERLREAVNKATRRGDYEIGISIEDESVVLDIIDAKVLANEIERDYIPRAEHEAEVERIVEARGDSGTVEELSNKVMRIYAMHKGVPMEDGESISEWLDRWYIKRPCDDKGKPWKMDDPIVFPEEGETTIDFFRFEDGEMRPGSYIGGGAVSYSPEDCKRPAPKVLDADDVEIKVGETDYWTLDGRHVEILQVGTYQGGKGCLVRSDAGLKFVAEGEDLTHREPDSLQKVLDFVTQWSHPDSIRNSSSADYSDAMTQVKDRLTALIERGA